MAGLEPFQLPNSGALTTRVGFGCSNLLGDKTRDMGLRLLETAYDSGIRHFDVARVYNFGDAEAILGEFAVGKRDKITISTKFGLMPKEGVARMKGPVQLARKMMRSSSWVRKLVRRNVKSLTQGGQFDLASAQKSLEASLRALRTDYLDIYLMHECNATDCTDDIFAFLQQARQDGKIRMHGCGTAFGRIPAIASEHAAFLNVAQFESSFLHPTVGQFQALRPENTALVITHGAMSAASSLRTQLQSQPSPRSALEQTLGCDLQADENLYGLLLRYAVSENKGGMVLFRAAAPERIRGTLSGMERIQLTPEQIGALQSLQARS